MDPRYAGETLKHLKRQNELLLEAHNSMSHELHKFQVEEEMLMRKFYDIMKAHGLTKKNDGSVDHFDGRQVGQSSDAKVANASNGFSDSGEAGLSTALVPVTSNDSNGGHSTALALASVSNGEQ